MKCLNVYEMLFSPSDIFQKSKIFTTLATKNEKQDGPSSGVKLDRTQVLEKTLSPSRPFDPRYLVTFGTLASLAPLAPLAPLEPLGALASSGILCRVEIRVKRLLTETLFNVENIEITLQIHYRTVQYSTV